MYVRVCISEAYTFYFDTSIKIIFAQAFSLLINILIRWKH